MIHVYVIHEHIRGTLRNAVYKSTYTLVYFCMCLWQVGKLKTLRSFTDISDGNVPVTVCKLALLSLMEVFKDVLPEYRIRVFTSKEKHQKVCCQLLCFSSLSVHRNMVRLIVGVIRYDTVD